MEDGFPNCDPMPEGRAESSCCGELCGRSLLCVPGHGVGTFAMEQGAETLLVWVWSVTPSHPHWGLPLLTETYITICLGLTEGGIIS